MDEEPSLEAMLNCTGALLELDARLEAPLPKFWPYEFNSSALTVGNISVDQVLNFLSPLLQNDDFSVPAERKAALRHFLTECLFPAQERPYALPWWQKLVWSIVFGAMLAVAIGGNAIVMWIVLAHRRMRSVTNYFLVNLSVSDLLMALLNCIFNFIFMLDSDWPFGTVYCSVNNFVANVSVAASVFTLVAISLDRYVAIVRPLKHRVSKRRARAAVTVIWLASMILAIPCLLYSTTMTKRYANGETRTVCYMAWPDGRYPTSMQEYVYNLIFLSLTYAAPIIAMAICYSIMGVTLWGSKSIGEQTQRQAESIRSKKKVVLMFILVVTYFAFCWLPYHGYFIYAYHNNDIVAASYVQHVYLGFYWLAMSNAMVNPIIYYWMNNRFRGYFQRIICECCCLRCDRSRALPPLDLPPYPNSSKRNGMLPGSPLTKNFQSETPRFDRSLRAGNSVHWHRQAQETRVSLRCNPDASPERHVVAIANNGSSHNNGVDKS